MYLDSGGLRNKKWLGFVDLAEARKLQCDGQVQPIRLAINNDSDEDFSAPWEDLIENPLIAATKARSCS